MADKKPVAVQPLSEDSTPTPWSEGCARLGSAEEYWLATTRPDCRPHVVPVLAVLVDDALHVVAGASTRKARNLARDPHCVVTARGPSLDLVLEGEAAKVRDEAKLQRVRDGARRRLPRHRGGTDRGSPPYDVYEVTPTTAFGFGTDGSLSSTRWRFS